MDSACDSKSIFKMAGIDLMHFNSVPVLFVSLCVCVCVCVCVHARAPKCQELLLCGHAPTVKLGPVCYSGNFGLALCAVV